MVEIFRRRGDKVTIRRNKLLLAPSLPHNGRERVWSGSTTSITGLISAIRHILEIRSCSRIGSAGIVFLYSMSEF